MSGRTACLALLMAAAAAAPALAGPLRADSPAIANPSPYSAALACLGSQAAWPGGKPPRIAVGRLSDMTGRNDLYTGARVSQGASLFAITALGRAGVPVVERLDSTVSEIELSYARQHLLSDAPEKAGTSANNFRPIYAGQIAGSSYYIVGGITELNYNIASSGINGGLGGLATDDVKGSASASRYVMNVAVDLRLVDTRSQEVVAEASFQKQLLGRDAGLTLSGVIDAKGASVGGGASAMEPVQAAVRTLVERGVFALLSDLQPAGVSATCLPESAR
jgi:curli production assembly/transport component CsgG/holdfast attachment protein HfaB